MPADLPADRPPPAAEPAPGERRERVALAGRETEIRIGSGGDVFIADRNNNRVQMFSVAVD